MSLRTIVGTIAIIAFVVVAGYLFAQSQLSKPEVTSTPLAAGNSFEALKPSATPTMIVRESNQPSIISTASPSGQPEATPATVKIQISDTDFSPSSVNISRGTTVIFVNDGQGVHWPESEEFDAKHGMQTGETFSYTFLQAGTFTYQDHINQSMKGTIIVK